MRSTRKTRNLAIFAAAAMVASSTAYAQEPDATVHFHGGSAAIIAGAHWGSGELTYRGRQYPLSVSGFSVGALGVSKYDASGNVYNLRHVADIEGTYSAVAASATVGAGAGVLTMKNSRGVQIKTTSTSAGLNLKLGPSGLTIKLKQ